MKLLIAFFLILLSMIYGCSPKESRDSESKHLDKIDSSLSKAIVDDADLFRFDFKILNMNSQEGADSIGLALDKLDAVIAYKTLLTESSCVIYADSFEVIDVISSAILELGYKYDKMLGVSGPGLTCGIEPDEDLTPNNEIIIQSLEENINSYKESFNKHIDKIRIVSIPNPSCLACVKGQRYINELFSKEFPTDTNLIGLTVWISINGWGTYEDAKRLAPDLQDDRMTHFWDPNMDLGKLFKPSLELAKDYTTAWDVYMIYDTGIVWDGKFPPAPTFWMHQIGNEESGVKKKLFLDKKVFSKNLRSIINNQNSY